ncbi:MAG: D-glycerate dehydrogenase [Candidatus Micrarchaeota archaeon]|nr:D-glycerate dehydrogenase [Candidatus Micrarchaeota archaeon]
MFKVLVTSDLPDSILGKLKAKCIVTKLKHRPTKSQLLKLIVDKDGIVCFVKIDADIMNAGKKLKVISNNAVGFDNIDVAEATKRGIAVTNTPGVLSQSVAEHTFALLAAISRRLVESDAITRSEKYNNWKYGFLFGTELKGKTLGIIGMGRIGSIVAKIATNGYGMKVVYYNPHRDANSEKHGIKYLPLAQLLKHSDFISLHVPLNEKTRHLIGEKQLSMMKPTAFLINTSRGAVIDEKALVKALQNKTIVGAALDVFEFEPKLSPGLSKLTNVILTPHAASATFEARSAMAEMAVENLLAVLEGGKPLSIVNPEVLLK